MSHELDRRVSALERIHAEEPQLVISFGPSTDDDREPSWLDGALIPIEGDPSAYIVRRLEYGAY
jgi:hypothetical protein